MNWGNKWELKIWSWGLKGLRCFGFRYANECHVGHLPLPNFKPRASGYESDYYGINNKRPTESERGNQELQVPWVWCWLGRNWMRYSHSKPPKFTKKCIHVWTACRSILAQLTQNLRFCKTQCALSNYVGLILFIPQNTDL